MESKSTQDARREFAAVIEDVLRGEHVELTRYGRPVAVIAPVEQYGRALIRHALDVSLQLDRTAARKKRIVEVQNRLTSWLAFRACDNGRPTAAELREAIGDATDRNVEAALTRWEDGQ